MFTLVTGASGHLGASLVRALLARGERVRALVHTSSAALEGLEVERVRGDVLDPASLEPAFRDAGCVYHLAGLISIDGDRGGAVQAVNVHGAGNVAEAALAAGVRRLVHVSSVHAFDHHPAGGPLDESRARSDQRPGLPAYDRSKALGENEIRQAMARGLDAVIAHPSAVIGPFDFQGSRTGRFLLDLARGRLPALLEGGYDWVDVRDVAAGLIAAAERGRTGESYLLGGRYATVAEIAGMVQAETGVAPPRTVPMWLARLGAPFAVAAGRLAGREPLYTGEALRALRASPRVVTDKARRELGYAPRPLEQTVRETLRWYAETGRLPSGAPAQAASSP